MSRTLDTVEIHLTRSLLSAIVEYFEDQRGVLGTVRFYELLASKLSQAIKRESPWSWRYAQGVHKGTILPSRDFLRAVKALGMALDDAPVATVGTEPVQVFADPGQVVPGSLVIGCSRLCANPGCGTWFIPNHPRRKYCGRCKR